MASVSSAASIPTPSPPLVTEETKEASKGLWYVGAIINVVGSVSINLGMNLMKLGHTKRAQLDMPEEEKPPIRKFKTWIIGITIFLTGNVLNFVSFAFAAQSLLAALGSLQLVCNVFFAYFVNHELVTKLIILSTCCIIGGCVLLVVFGNQSSETYTVDQLIHFYTLPAYVVYLVMMAVFVFGFYVLYLHSKKVCRKRGEQGIWYGIMLVSYAIFSALLGSQSVLFGKSISVILRTTFTESNQLRNWYTWVVLPLFLFTAVFWVTRLNKGLRMFPAMVIVPLLQIAWTLFSIVSGMLYFQEYKGFTTLKAIMFPVGVLVVFAGVFILTAGGRAAPEEDEDEEEAVDGTEQRTAKLSVYDNAVYSARSEGDGHPGDSPYGGQLVPQSKIPLGQTLRLTSTWAPPSVALSPGSNLNRTLLTSESLRRPRRATAAPSDLNATIATTTTTATDPMMMTTTGRTDGDGDGDLTPRLSITTAATTAAAAGQEHHHHRHHPGGGGGGGGFLGNRTFDHNSTLNRTAQSNTSRVSETSMVSTMRKGLKSMGSALTSDMGLDMAGFKLAVGLGDSYLSGVSLFAMPALDFTATAKRKPDNRQSRTASRINGARINEEGPSLLSSLPKSRFYRADPDGLAVIRETSGVPASTKPPSPDLGASLTTSSQLLSNGSSRDSQATAIAAAAAAGRAGSSSTSPDTGRNTPLRKRQDQQQNQQYASQPPPQAAAAAATAVTRGPSEQPLTEAALLNLLPVSSFQEPPPPLAPSLPADGGPQRASLVRPRITSEPASPRRSRSAAAPVLLAAAAAPVSDGSRPGSGGAGKRRRSRRPSTLPDPSGYRSPRGPVSGFGGGTAVSPAFAAAVLQSGYDSDVYPSAAATPPRPLQYRTEGSGLGGAGGSAALDPSAAGTARAAAAGCGAPSPGDAGGTAVRGARAPLPKSSGLGAILPEGVPLSTANSVVIHESGADTPADGMGIGGMGQQQERWRGGGYGIPGGRGGGGGGGAGTLTAPGARPQQSQALAWQRSATPTPSKLLPPQTPWPSLQLQQAMLLAQQQQQQQQQIPLPLLHRAQTPPRGSVRLPALHLMVPGLPVFPSQLPPPASSATATGALYRQYSTASLSYAQMLAAGQALSDGGGLFVPQTLLAGSLSVGGATMPAVGSVVPAAVRPHGRSQSPHGGLSVSRSWVGLSGLSGGGGDGGARQSPLRGTTLIGQMQRPLRPWQ